MVKEPSTGICLRDIDLPEHSHWIRGVYTVLVMQNCILEGLKLQINAIPKK